MNYYYYRYYSLTLIVLSFNYSIYNGAIARYLPNSTIFYRPIIGSPKASALAAHPIYLFTSVLATPFPSL